MSYLQSEINNIKIDVFEINNAIANNAPFNNITSKVETVITNLISTCDHLFEESTHENFYKIDCGDENNKLACKAKDYKMKLETLFENVSKVSNIDEVKIQINNVNDLIKNIEILIKDLINKQEQERRQRVVPKKKPKTLIIVIVLFLVILLIAGLYFYFSNKKNKETEMFIFDEPTY